jgi:hypothetical protein
LNRDVVCNEGKVGYNFLTIDLVNFEDPFPISNSDLDNTQDPEIMSKDQLDQHATNTAIESL